MQYCSSCKKTYATIHILEIKDDEVVDQRHLCAACAEGSGMGTGSPLPLKLHQMEMLDLIGNQKASQGDDHKTCPGCDLSSSEFMVRGRTGCPRCYDTFKVELIPLLERVHDATSHRGRFATTAPRRHPSESTLPLIDPDAEGRPGDEHDAGTPPRAELEQLHSALDAAVAEEAYERAAELRDRIRALEADSGGAAEGAS